jgi:transposase
MSNKQKQKVYTAEFKREAVRLLASSGKSGALIAEALGSSDGSLYTWRKQLAQQGDEAFPGKGHQPPTEEEFRQLRSEVERLKQERDILKKAIAIFSQPPGQK